jgi:hypothetical protein
MRSLAPQPVLHESVNTDRDGVNTGLKSVYRTCEIPWNPDDSRVRALPHRSRLELCTACEISVGLRKADDVDLIGRLYRVRNPHGSATWREAVCRKKLQSSMVLLAEMQVKRCCVRDISLTKVR